MNYLRELNAFRDWLMKNDLPSGAIVLWHTLMSIDNAAGWKKRFNAPNAVVRQLSGLSKQGLLDARKRLIEHQLIKCENGKKGRAPVYEMNAFLLIADQSDYPSLDSSSDASGDRLQDPYQGSSQGKSLNIPKQKQRQKRRREDARETALLTLYENNISKLTPIMKDACHDWVEAVGEAIMTEAIKITAKYGGRSFSYTEKILKEWMEADLTTITDVRAYEKQKDTTKRKTIPFKQRKQSVFDELREEADI